MFGGLSGMIIVNGLQQLLPPALQDIEDVGIALKDAQVVRGKIQEDNIDSDAPTLRVVNSAHLPVQTIAPGEVQLWRLANIGADIWYNLALDGQPFVVIGEDGNPVWQVHSSEHPHSPAGQALRRAGDRRNESVDLADAPVQPAGRPVPRREADEGGEHGRGGCHARDADGTLCRAPRSRRAKWCSAAR